MLWTEKYRPNKLAEIVGQESFKLDAENWIEINAKGRTLGRLATEISVYLLGKNKPTYSPDKLSDNLLLGAVNAFNDEIGNAKNRISKNIENC